MFFSRQLHEVWQHKIRDGKIYFNGNLGANHHNHTKYIEKGTGCDKKKTKQNKTHLPTLSNFLDSC